MGWKIVGGIESEVKKCVMMVMPHTSNHDFYLGVFTICSLLLFFLGIFIGKKFD